MLGNFLKIELSVVCFLKPIKICLILTRNDTLSSKQVGSQASRRVTRRLAWIQPVCISLNAVPALEASVKVDLVYIYVNHFVSTFCLCTSL